MTSAARHAIIVGAGPAGLAAAEVLGEAGWRVTVHERMPNPARKFLLAGRGGLNLTHSEPLEAFLDRYGAARAKLEAAIRAFAPADLRAWCEGLGIETFIGSSGRVFPKQMKASPLLRAWLARLGALGVQLAPRSRWTGWDGDALVFGTPDGVKHETPDATIFALGGASWPRLGSDGAWRDAFVARGVRVTELRPANSGFRVEWSEVFRERFAGEPLKPAAFVFAGGFSNFNVRGEAIITSEGIEGGAIYAMSSALRDFIAKTGRAYLTIDLAPHVAMDALAERLAASPKTSMANRLRKAGLSPVAAGLIREDHRAGGATLPTEAAHLAHRIKACTIRLTAPAGIERAISTAGGIRWDGVAPDFSLKADPRTFVAGEMLDWEAPTGGYLLQACFATGRAAAKGVLAQNATTKG
jgi:uncharacterized flavoprotein (TIGR03862 family)